MGQPGRLLTTSEKVWRVEMGWKFSLSLTMCLLVFSKFTKEIIDVQWVCHSLSMLLTMVHCQVVCIIYLKRPSL